MRWSGRVACLPLFMGWGAGISQPWAYKRAIDFQHLDCRKCRQGPLNVPGINDISVVDVGIGSTHAGITPQPHQQNRKPLMFGAVLLSRSGAVYTWGLSKYGSLGAGQGVVEAAAPRKAGDV